MCALFEEQCGNEHGSPLNWHRQPTGQGLIKGLVSDLQEMLLWDQVKQN